MRVGIVEIMDSGHITFAETLCRIFCCDNANQVFLLTIRKHAVNLDFLLNIYNNLNIVVREKDKDLKEFLNETGNLKLDRVYIVTLTRYFRIISEWNINTRLFLTIHNTDEWFRISFPESLKKFFYLIKSAPTFNLWIYFFKVCFVFPPFKRRILKTVKGSGGSLVVLSDKLRMELDGLSTGIPSEVIPFSVFDPKLAKVSASHEGQLRICVPGILSQYRRDYLGLLGIIEKRLNKFRDLFIIDFLGGVTTDNQMDNPSLILKRIDMLINMGFSIIIHNVPFIPPVEYDSELAKADIILGNMNVALTRYSIYGKTKETGIPFAMIKAARPGILPGIYPVTEELMSSTLVYNDLEDLAGLLQDIISNRQKVEELKKNALLNSYKFTPEVIYTNLTGKSQI